MLKVLNANVNTVFLQMDKLIKNKKNTVVISDHFICDGIDTITVEEMLCNINRKTVLDKTTQELVIRNIIIEKRNNFKIIDEYDANSISELLSEAVSEEISVKSIKHFIENNNVEFKDKLSEIFEIYQCFLEYLDNNNYTISEQAISKFNDEYLQKYDSFIFLPLSNYPYSLSKLIFLLLKNDKNVMLIFDDFSIKNTSTIQGNSSIFKNEIISFVQEKTEYQVEVVSPDILSKTDVLEDFVNVKKHLLVPTTEEKGELKNIKFYNPNSVLNEIEFISSQISMLRSMYNYSDMAIVVNDLDSYIPILRTSLSAHPISISSNKPFSKSYLYNFFMTLFSYCEKPKIDTHILNQLIRFSCFGVTNEEQDIIDLFFLRFGNDFDTAMKNGEKFDFEGFKITNKVVSNLNCTLNSFKDEISYCSTIKDFLITTISFLEKIEFTKHLQNICKDIKNEDSYKIYRQWDVFNSIFLNLNQFFADKKTNLTGFIDIFSRFSSKTDVEYFYSSNKNVIEISDVSTYKEKNKKILFLIGNIDSVKNNIQFDSIINSFERKILNVNLNCNLKTDEYYIDAYNYKIENIIGHQRQTLFISWPKTSISGKEVFPASYINNLMSSFNIVEEKSLNKIDNEMKLTNLLLEISNEKYSGISDELISDDFVELCNDEYYAKRLYKALNFLYKDKSKINANNPEEIYRDTKYFSATRLENFNKCPFKHFVDYGVLPQKLNIFGEDAASRGDYFHSVFNAFYSTVIDKKIDLQLLSDKDISNMLDPIFKEIESSHNDGALSSTFRNLYQKEQMRKKASASVINSVKQLTLGKFKPSNTEFNISKNIECSLKITLSSGKDVFITGIIDRFDIADDRYARIIDYKSSSKNFNMQDLEKGIQLQLPLYSSAINNKYHAVGMYYFHIQNPILDIDKKECDILKKFQLSGPTLANASVINNSDKSFESKGKSDIIPVSITKSGSFTSYSQVYTTDEFSEILNKAQSVAQSTIENILSGDVIASPIRGTSVSPCSYCDYNRICHNR